MLLFPIVVNQTVDMSDMCTYSQSEKFHVYIFIFIFILYTFYIFLFLLLICLGCQLVLEVNDIVRKKIFTTQMTTWMYISSFSC